ncbi:MAG TPA: nucleotide disphospho-sugar-binding domain-containing protein [Gaiellaceae bacterium]|nr:nucleotide disphospho-sugar-binding domain-containing protein [Gaiellaceae bacterium]
MSQTIAFLPEGAYGPTNNCVGIGQVLRERGHRVVFVIEESFAGSLEAQGFEERLMRLGPPPEVEEEPGQFWKDFIRDTAPVFRKPTIEQLSEFIEPTWRALCDGSRYVDERLREIFDELRPDVIVEDNVLCFPAIHHSGRPWVRIVSCNPLELKDDAIPPVFSGYPAADRTGWDGFRAEYSRAIADLHGEFSAFCAERHAPALPADEFIHESEWLNLYLYPDALDYERAAPCAPTWHRLESCVRRVDGPDGIPDELGTGDGALVYLSLGSLGSADVELMKRLVDVLARSPHRFVVSKGPQHTEYELADNMWGEEFLPQPAILPRVDLVITHAGNNTTTECIHFGKPMIALPLFWDQYDNAQRVDETGYGIRLPTYEFEEDDLLGAIERLLADGALAARMAAIASQVQAAPGTVKAAGLIERVGRDGVPVTR